MRHGAVENPDQVRYGRLPGFHLSAEGRKQVTEAAHSFLGRPIQHMYVSPLERTQQTATLLGFVFPYVPLTLDGRLLEVKTAKQFEGKSRDIHFYYSKERKQDAETAEELVSRVYRFIEEKIIAHNGGEVILVSHGDPIALLYNYLVYGQVGLPKNFYPTYASVLTFVFDGLVLKTVGYKEVIKTQAITA